jgi:hypothetical protein
MLKRITIITIALLLLLTSALARRSHTEIIVETVKGYLEIQGLSVQEVEWKKEGGLFSSHAVFITFSEIDSAEFSSEDVVWCVAQSIPVVYEEIWKSKSDVIVGDYIFSSPSYGHIYRLDTGSFIIGQFSRYSLDEIMKHVSEHD